MQQPARGLCDFVTPPCGTRDLNSSLRRGALWAHPVGAAAPAAALRAAAYSGVWEAAGATGGRDVSPEPQGVFLSFSDTPRSLLAWARHQDDGAVGIHVAPIAIPVNRGRPLH